MPEKKTLKRASADKRKGKSASTQAGEFVREEIHHVREGKHGARNTKQAIAIGLSKARRSGVELTPPKKGNASAATRKKAQQDLAKGRKQATGNGNAKPAAKRSAATKKALKKEPRSAASHRALSKHAKRSSAARQRRSAA